MRGADHPPEPALSAPLHFSVNREPLSDRWVGRGGYHNPGVYHSAVRLRDEGLDVHGWPFSKTFSYLKPVGTKRDKGHFGCPSQMRRRNLIWGRRVWIWTKPPGESMPSETRILADGLAPRDEPSPRHWRFHLLDKTLGVKARGSRYVLAQLSCRSGSPSPTSQFNLLLLDRDKGRPKWTYTVSRVSVLSLDQRGGSGITMFISFFLLSPLTFEPPDPSLSQSVSLKIN